MATGHCISYHPHPAAALQHEQFQNTRQGLADTEYYHYYEDQFAVDAPLEGKPSCPPDLILPPPPYYRERDCVDVLGLPPLPETPQEEDPFAYSDDVFGNYTVAGDRRPLRREFESETEAFVRSHLASDSSSAFSQPHHINGGQSSETKLTTNIMGSSGSMLGGNRVAREHYQDECRTPKLQPRELVALSEKRDKQGSGMKKKLRHSLDKLSIRAFNWGSTDKLSSSSTSSVASKSKKSNGKGGVRRYSDSNAPASINSITSVLSKVRKNRDSPTKRPGSSSSYNDIISVRKIEGNSVVSKGWKQSGKLVKAYMGGSKDALRDVTAKQRQNEGPPTISSPMNPHLLSLSQNDRKRSGISESGRKSLPLEENVSTKFRPIAFDNDYGEYPSKHSKEPEQAYTNQTYQSIGPAEKLHNTDCEYPTKPWQDQAEPCPEYNNRYYTVRGNNKAGIVVDGTFKAKGTWNLLKNTNSPFRVTYSSSNPASSYNSPCGSTETLLSSGSRPRPKSTNKILDSTPEGVQFARPAPPDSKLHPPPKLTPVSGKLIVSKNSNASSIVRPTAFKAVVPAMRRISPPSDSTCSWHHINENGERPDITISADTYDCDSSQNTDSGRNSTSSINVISAKLGSSYSASEGYESARVSSSTAHDQHSDKGSDSGRPTSTSATASQDTRSAPDDVMIRDLESKVRERENDIIRLQKSLEENEKTLSRVYEERDDETQCDLQVEPQIRKSMKSQELVLRGCDLLQEGNKPLHHLNKQMQLEDRLAEASSAGSAEVTLTADRNDVRQLSDTESTRSRLEDCQWTLQQKCGEISLLKTRLRESQAEINRRATEVATQRSQNRELRSQRHKAEREAEDLLNKLKARDTEIIELERKLRRSTNSTPHSRSSSCSSATPGGNSVCFSSSPPPSPNAQYKCIHGATKYGKSKRKSPATVENNNNNNGHADLIQSHLLLQAEVETLRRKLSSAEEREKLQTEKFERERARWNDEKLKVIRYQKKLQASYVESHKRSQELEERVQFLSEELCNLQKMSSSEHSTVGDKELRFPTDI